MRLKDLQNGQQHIVQLLPFFEEYLDSSSYLLGITALSVPLLRFVFAKLWHP